MYLARLRLDLAHPQARRDLASVYEMHRTLSRAFARSADDPPARFLWRLESQGTGAFDAPPTVLVQSAEPGNWVALDDWPGYLCERVEMQLVNLERLLRPGRTCIYRLACNPTVTRVGKRFGLVRESEQIEWLQRQGQKHGFALAAVRVGRSERVTVSQGRGGQRITVLLVQFDGMLRVVDPGSLTKALVQGVGHAKALGLGMLSIAPAGANEVS